MKNLDGNLQAKIDLASKITTIIEQLNLTQTEAGKTLNLGQPWVSRLMRGSVAGFSIDRLFHFLNLLGYDVEIIVSKGFCLRGNPGSVKVI